MNSPVEQIKERLSIEEVVSSYIKLERAGANLKAKCPFHNEKTPSFFVSPDRGSYYCFGCGASGDIFTFIEEFEGLDFKGALKVLADRAGVPLSLYQKESSPEKEGEKERLYQIMETATFFFESNLKNEKSVQDYLKNRGLEEKTIKDFRIGFAKNEWRDLFSYLKQKGFKDTEIVSAGLAKRIDSGQKGEEGFYDRFRGRIIFPIADSSGRVIAFSGRIFDSAPTKVEDPTVVGSKYLNSPDTPIFKKSAVLYGIDKAKNAIRKNDFSIIVEGQFDLILAHQAGFKNTVATSGTALVDSEKKEDEKVNSLGVVKRLSSNVVFIFDSDKAGFQASLRATPIALALFNDMNVKAAEVPNGKDPADLISQNGVDAWRGVVRGAKHIIEFLLDKFIVLSENKDKLKLKTEIAEKIVPFLNKIRNPIKRAHFVSMIADRTSITEEIIRDMANTKLAEGSSFSEGGPEKTENSFRRDYIERKLFGLVLWQEEAKNKKLDVSGTLARFSQILKKDFVSKLENARKNKEDLVFEAEVFYGGEESLDQETTELFSNLEEEYLKEILSRKMFELRLAEEKKDVKHSAEILKDISELNQKIQNIKNSRFKK